jgi:hypothetical protein
MIRSSIPSDPRVRRTFRSRSVHLPLAPLPLEGNASQISRLLAMNTRLEARLRSLVTEREKLARLLDEADAALAAAGIPYLQDNIRERISAYQVFKKVQIFPL